jgi:hypothetical protein
MANPDKYPFEQTEGPTRRELLDAIGAPAPGSESAVALDAVLDDALTDDPDRDGENEIVIDSEDAIHA